MAYYKSPTDNFISTTLNGSINDAVDSIILNDASKLQYPGYIVIDREDGNGTATPTAREVISYTGITSNTLTGCTRGADNSTARSHSDGALVEPTFVTGMWTGIRDPVAAALSTDGTGLTITATASIGTTQAVNLCVSSIASVARLEYLVGKMALNSNASGGVACDFDTANLFTRTLNATTTVYLTNWGTGDKAVIRLPQGASGTTVAWYPGSGATINWVDNTVPTLTYALDKVDVFGFLGASDTRLDGFVIGQGL